jgi:3-hydroxyacyl-CoA dehydrogenase
MSYTIRKAAVIGSGTMGGGIAALLAGIGVETLLLDIPAKDTQPGDPSARRNAVVTEGVKRLGTLRPPSLLLPADADALTLGNIDDDLGKVADCDWVIEVVVERLDVKQTLMSKLAEVIAPKTIVSTNTSGLPIRDISAHLDADFRRRFLGTHFFNPPRYLHLLEVIPGADTDPEIVRALVEFATVRLGKGVVICQDEPNFIGNRFMTLIGMQTVNATLDGGFTVEEVDSLTGPLIGRPKTATYRLNDLVGIDIAVHVARNLYPAIPGDPARPVLEHPGAAALFDKLMANGWLGSKTGQGFYKSVKNPATGEREFWSLDLSTFDYLAPGKPRFDSVGKHRKVEDTGERIRLLIAETDRAGKFLFDHIAFYLAYASHRVPEITETLVNIDNAQKWGFSHELGPFEIWDAIGVAESIPRFEAAGCPVAQWVKDMIAAGHTHFYQRDAAGTPTAYYSPQDGAYRPTAADPRLRRAAQYRAGGKAAGNGGASLLDMGDGVALLELHSPAQALDQEVIEMLWRTHDLLESRFDALVIGTDAERFCVGANLVLVSMAAQSDPQQVETMGSQLQGALQALRCASKPVVVAAHNMALGGGAELLMAGTRAVAHMELYAGLVEVGVGLLPAAGGCKELLRRVVNPVLASHPDADPLPHLRKVFEQIALAKVSGSAKEAREMGLLAPADRIVMHRGHLLTAAKREALHLTDGYVPARPGKIYAAGRDAYAALLLGIDGFVEGGYASEHDALIARKVAYVLTGGAISEPAWVDEQTILDLERRAFMELVVTPKTLERMAHMVQTNKALRN